MKNIALFIVFNLITTFLVQGQKQSLENLLWTEVGGKINPNEEHGGQYDINDDAKNGYLKVAFTEEGCGCYSETTVGAYKDSKGNYTTLKVNWDGCSSKKTLSSNSILSNILPQDFGLQTFMPNTGEPKRTNLSAFLYLEVTVPRKGTDTRIDLAFVPFGINIKGEDRILSFSGYGREFNGAKYSYHEDIKAAFETLTDELSLKYLLNKEFDKINSKDKKILIKLFGNEKPSKNIKHLQAIVSLLKLYYKSYQAIKYNSVILGWSREESRFHIKEKIKNDDAELSFLEFIRQLPFLMAVC